VKEFRRYVKFWPSYCELNLARFLGRSTFTCLLVCILLYVSLCAYMYAIVLGQV